MPNKQTAEFVEGLDASTKENLAILMNNVSESAAFHGVHPYQIVKVLEDAPIVSVMSASNPHELDKIIINGLYEGEEREERLENSNERAARFVALWGNFERLDYTVFPTLVQMLDLDNPNWREEAEALTLH
jgi:hypothetical protein